MHCSAHPQWSSVPDARRFPSVPDARRFPSWKFAFRSQIQRFLKIPLMVLCLLILLPTAWGLSCQGLWDDSLAEIVPRGDIIGRIGEDIEVFCHFNSSIPEPQNIIFKQFVAPDYVPLQTTTVNESTKSIVISEPKPGKFNLFCGKKGVKNNYCFRTVKIGDDPQDLEDFHCKSPNWEWLTCTFRRPFNPMQVKYSFTYKVKGFPSIFDKNVTYDGDIGNITWQVSGTQGHGIGTRRYVILTVVGNNTFGTRTYQHEIDVYRAVIPGKALSLKASSVTSHSALLEWKIPHQMQGFSGGSIVHEIAWRIGPHDEWTKVQGNSSLDDYMADTFFNDTVELPYPFVNYTIRQRMHTGIGPLDEDMWSQPTLTIAKTRATAPSATVATDVSSFEVNDALDAREILVYWRILDGVQQNGPHFKYSVRAYTSEDYMPVSEHPVLSTKANARFKGMSKDKSYIFHIRAQNSQGSAPNTAEVFVPRTSKIPSKVASFNVIKYRNPDPLESNPIYRFIWKAPTFTPAEIVSYTIFWCDIPHFSTRCEGKMHWETITSPLDSLLLNHDVQVNFPVDSRLYEKNFTSIPEGQRFAIAAVDSSGSSSGLKWASCSVAVEDSPPSPKKPKVTVLNSRRTKVTWVLDCPDQAAVPLGVNISYCEISERTCTTPKQHLTRPLLPPSVEIPGLRPSSKVAFYVSVLSVVGASRSSPETVVTMFEDVPEGPPLDVSVDQVTNSSVTLSWDPPLPLTANGAITKYIVETSPSSGDVEHLAQEGGRQTLTVSSLLPFTSYSVSVFACTRKGCSKTHSADASFKTEPGVPELVRLKSYNLNSIAGALTWGEYDTKEKCHSLYCTFDLNVTYNYTSIYNTNLNQSSITLQDLNITCSEGEALNISIRAVGRSSEGLLLPGPWNNIATTCTLPGITALSLWIYISVAAVALIILFVGVCLLKCGSNVCQELRKPIRPPDLRNESLMDMEKKSPSHLNGKGVFFSPPYSHLSRGEPNTAVAPYENKKMPLLSQTSQSSDGDHMEEEGERHGRNLSGDSTHSAASGTSSEADSALASTRDSSSNASGDSNDNPRFGRQDADTFPLANHLRQRSPGPYVQHGVLHQKNLPEGYVTVRSNPSLIGSATNLSHQGPMVVGATNPTLQRSTPNLPAALSGNNLSSMHTPATSAGYFSTTESEPHGEELLALSTMPRNKSGVSNGGVNAPPYSTAAPYPLPHYSRHSFTPPGKFKPPPPSASSEDRNTQPLGDLKYVAIACVPDVDSTSSRLSSPDSYSFSYDNKRRPPSMPSLQGMADLEFNINNNNNNNNILGDSSSPYCVVGRDSRKFNIQPLPSSSHGYVTANCNPVLQPFNGPTRASSGTPQKPSSTPSSAASSHKTPIPGTGYVAHNQNSPPGEPIELRHNRPVLSDRPEPQRGNGYVTLGERDPSATSTRNGSAVSNPRTGSSVTNGYVPDDPSRWARPALRQECIDTAEEVRDIASAPCEVRYPEKSTTSPQLEERPRTSDCVPNRPKKMSQSPSGWHLGRPSLSKQSSGYVSQEALGAEQIMTPNTLIAQSNDHNKTLTTKGTAV